MLLVLGKPRAVAARLVLDGLDAAAAYGMRKLRGAYAGPCVRLRRSGDNAERDFGFAGGSVDRGAISAWLGGNAGFVAKWYDQSGRGRDATQTVAANQPSVEPANAFAGCLPITADGVASGSPIAKFLALPPSLSLSRRNFSAFCLLNPLVSLQSNIHFELNTNLAGVANLFTEPANGGIGLHSYDGTANQVMAAFVPRAQPVVDGLVGSGSGYSSYLDGLSASLTAPSDAAMAGGSIGKTSAGAGYNARNDYFAFIVFSRALNADEARALSSALRSAFGLTAAGDVQLVLDGDSITEGFGAARLRNNARQMEPLLAKPVRLFNMGVYGQTMANMNANKGNITGLYDGTRSKNICLVAGGSNDLVNNNLAASTVYGSLTSYTAALRAAGYKVVWGTVLPRADADAADQTRISDYNTLLRNNHAAAADGLADYAAHATLGLQATTANATYYADGVHPTSAGYAIMAGIAAPAINALL